MIFDGLPGLEVTVQDGNLILPAQTASTATILIIAPITEAGEAGPYTADEMNPQYIRSQSDIESKGFGTYTATNPLARLWKQAWDAGCRSIQAIKLKGTTPEQRYGFLNDIYYVLEENISADIVLIDVKADEAITATGVTFANAREDFAAPVVIDNSLVTVVSVEEAIGTGDGTKVAFNLTNKPVIASTVAVTVAGTVVPKADYTVAPLTGIVTFVAGEEPAAAAAVKATYSHYSFNFAAQLAGFCDTVSEKTRQLLGVIALKKPADNNLATIKAYVAAQTTQKYSKNLQVVGGSTGYFQLGATMYEDMWAGAYAGLISVLAAQSSTTYKTIPGMVSTPFNLSPSQLDSLSQKHIVAPRFRNNRIMVSDGVTTALDTSDFVRLTTVRIVNTAVQTVRQIAEPYIGEPNKLEMRNSLDTAIKTGLRAMVNAGALTDFRSQVVASITDQLDGNMNIYLDLVPAFETKHIRIQVAVKPFLA